MVTNNSCNYQPTLYNVQTGGSNGNLNNVAPSATSGVPVISQGASSQPVFGTAVVAGGGTGATSFNANGAVISNTTTTGALLSVALSNQKFLVGNTSAAPTAKALSVVNQVFTGSGTYTPTSGMVYCLIEAVGGGGGGGGTATSTGGFYSGGAGGGSGGYSRLVSSAATIGASQTVTIGAAGSAGSAGNNAGGNGGDTSVGTLCIGKGGTGGGGNNGATGVNGGAGGVAGTGDLTFPGQSGGPGPLNGTAAGVLPRAGEGAASYFGGGSPKQITNAANLTGAAGTNYGSGGAGGISFNAGGAIAGGAGTAGLVIIQEFVLS